MKNKIIITLLLILLISSVNAISTTVTDKLNFWNSETHTVVMTNDEGSTVDLNATIPTGFTFGSSSQCTNPSGQIIYCSNIANGNVASFTMTSPSSGVGEYEVATLTSTAGSTSNADVKFVRIKDEELFLTLVEFGRGKGNYFFSSQGRGGSGQQSTGYKYIPTESHFELNYLHKLYPTIGNYLGVPTAEGEGLIINCDYPNASLLKHHLATGIILGNPVEISYEADLLTTSWERLMWAVQSYDSGVYSDGDELLINCTDIHYYLPDAKGNVSISEDSFVLEFATKSPITVSATSDPATINNGTSEVDITYVFTNSEDYPISPSTDPLRITILSPEGADYIGVKGELFGTAKDEFDIEIPSLPAGESYTTTITARFDTSSMTATSINLSRGVEVQFVPSWEVNSYNPMSIDQDVLVTDTLTISYGTQSHIVGVMDRIEEINQTTNEILLDTAEINNTINTLEQYLIDINGTVTTIETTTNTINTNVLEINQTTNNVYTDTQLILENLDCDGTNDTPLCDYVEDINNTVSGLGTDINSILTLVTEINGTTWTTYNDMQQNFTDMFVDLSSIQGDVTTTLNNVNLALDYLNCTISSEDSVCYRLGIMNTSLNNIYTDTQNIYTDTQYMINTQLPNINTSIINEIQALNFTTDLTEVLTKIRQLKEFDEESIYLITDSMVEASNSAMKSFAEGNVEESIQYVEETQKLLNTLNIKVDEMATKESTKLKIDNGLMSTNIKSTGIFGKLMGWLQSIFSFN